MDIPNDNKRTSEANTTVGSIASNRKANQLNTVSNDDTCETGCTLRPSQYSPRLDNSRCNGTAQRKPANLTSVEKTQGSNYTHVQKAKQHEPKKHKRHQRRGAAWPARRRYGWRQKMHAARTELMASLLLVEDIRNGALPAGITARCGRR